MNTHDGSGVKSAERALTILELFSRRDSALTFTQVVDLLGYPRSSLHGLLHTLTDRGWLHYDAPSRRYTLGIRAWEAGNAYRPAVELSRRAGPVVERLRQVVDGTVHLALLDDHDAVRVVDTADHSTTRVPAHATGAGRVLLADLDRPERERHVAGHAVPDATDLHRRLDRVRSEGWADDDGASDGHRTLAVPVRDVRGVVVAALGVSAPAPRLTAERRDDALRALRQGAEQIASALGTSPPS